MWDEFKKFAFKGNVLDLAIGVIMGGAFGKIVTSVVNDLIMPLLGYLMAGVDFKSLKFVMSEAVMEGETVIKPRSSNFIRQLYSKRCRLPDCGTIHFPLYQINK